MSTPSANPTPITPPRVPFFDERSRLISREWYMFFLSLYRAAEVALATEVGNNSNSQIASLTEALDQLRQAALTQPGCIDSQALDQLRQAALTQPNYIDLQALEFLQQAALTQPAVAQQQLDALRQELWTQPRAELGTMAALQQSNVPWLTFDTTPEFTPPDVGTLAYGGGVTLGFQATANVVMRLGEAEFVYVKASSAITKGQLCYHTGSVGASGVITAAPSPLALVDPNQIVGVAAESIALNGFGLIQISGTLRGFDTTGTSVGEVWADGDALYYNPAFVGAMTKVKPSAPNQKSFIGEVINAGSGGSGSMSIRIVPGSVLGGTDSNVQISTPSNSDLLQYSTSLGYWRNVAASSVTVGTANNLAGGAAGSVPYQTGAGATTFLPIGIAAQVLKVNAGATAPEWVSGAALTKTDDTNVTLTLGGTPGAALLAATSLTLGWTGTLAVGRGGTGLGTTPTNGQLLIGNGTNYTLATLTAGTGITITNGAGSITVASNTGAATLPSAITVTASPFTYQNTSAYPVDVIVSGGGVSVLEFTRDNATFYDTGSYYGMFTLSPNDRLRVTYTVAPTMTLIPR